MQSWMAVILRLFTLGKNIGLMAYKLFDSDKHTPILSDI